MKRLTILTLCLCVLISAVGCARNEAPPKSPVSFYYPLAETVYDGSSPVIQPEAREGAGFEDDTEGLLNLYLQGPTTDTLRSPFPSGVTVSRYTTTANTAILELNSEFAGLSGIGLTLACVSVAYTLFDLTGLDRVQLSVADAQLDGQDFVTFVRDTIYFTDATDPTGNTSEATASSGQ